MKESAWLGPDTHTFKPHTLVTHQRKECTGPWPCSLPPLTSVWTQLICFDRCVKYSISSEGYWINWRHSARGLIGVSGGAVWHISCQSTRAVPIISSARVWRWGMPWCWRSAKVCVCDEPGFTLLVHTLFLIYLSLSLCKGPKHAHKPLVSVVPDVQTCFSW